MADERYKTSVQLVTIVTLLNSSVRKQVENTVENMPLYNCSPAAYAGFLRYFNAHSHNGVMGRSELRAILNRAGVQPSNSELQEIIDLVSVDGSGINWQCFVDFVSSYQAFRDVEQEYADAFRIYDVSGNGVLSRDDIRYVMGRLGINVNVDSLMDEVDKNHDNSIDYDEFVDMMKRKVF